MGRKHKQTFLQRIHTDGQEAHEKMFNIISYQRNTNQNWWMKLEPIIQSEVSQKEKHQYSILMHIYGIQKDGNDDSICKTAKKTDVKNSLCTLWEKARVGGII